MTTPLTSPHRMTGWIQRGSPPHPKQGAITTTPYPPIRFRKRSPPYPTRRTQSGQDECAKRKTEAWDAGVRLTCVWRPLRDGRGRGIGTQYRGGRPTNRHIQHMEPGTQDENHNPQTMKPIHTRTDMSSPNQCDTHIGDACSKP